MSANADVSAAAGSGVEAARPAAEASPYPGGRGWSPPPAAYGQSQDTNLTVRMSDGAVLKVDVVYPTDPATGARLAGPFPVILNQDPYTGGALSLSSALSGSPPTNFFATHGYIYVHLHDRGTAGPGPNGSEGATDLTFGPRHGLDGVEMAYWAADANNVPGSKGTVGLYGCSALGIIQLSTLVALGRLERLGDQVYVPGPTVDAPGHIVAATDQTNPIKAAAPACFATSEYREQFTDNGVGTPQFAVAFLAPIAGVALFGASVDNPTSGLGPTSWSVDNQTGGDYGYDRQFWQERDWLRHADDIGRTGVPLLMQVGYAESGFTAAQPLFGALQNYAHNRVLTDPMLPDQPTSPKYQVVIGHWGHAGGLDPGLDLEWFETWVRGVDTGLQSATGAMHLEELSTSGANRWISPTSYPMTTDYGALYLGSAPVPSGAGGLSAETPSAAPDSIIWGAGPQLTYTTNPFGEDTTLYGPATAELWVSTSTSNIQLYVELQDVAPDGSVTEITHGSILGSRAQLDPTRTWTLPSGLSTRPWLTLDDDRLMAANVPTKLAVPLQPKTWRLGAGHRLRMAIAPNPGQRCVPTESPIGAPVPYGCMISASLLPSLAGGVFQVLHDGQHGRASLLSAALVPSAQIPTTTSGTTPTSGGAVLPQDWGRGRS